MSNYPTGIGNYFEREAEETRRQERRWEIIIEEIGDAPFYKIEGDFFGEEQAIEVLNDEYGQGNYELDQWIVSEEEVFNKIFGGY